ncbi:hypothetical protein C2S52_012645 [Perilla frutescens var. hirtella]|nr:hypothetical protein C2S51_015036 [Perilla frutescens var. frutescens]KAH6775084.1 hypothetical protein C2S52_012645 [Perilla frutescens var. hirtella]
MNGVEVVASWFTPAVLFCVLNLMIGTIFYRSTLKPPRTLLQNKDDQLPPPQLVRVPSFFERVKSFNLSRHQEELHHHETEEPHHVTRSKSDAVAKAAPAARVLQKSASVRVSTEKEEEDEERRRPATVRERTAAEDEAEDEKAGDFINRFRQQLKLQRLDSLLRQRGSGR